MRSHIVFKFLNYVTDQIFRVVLITLVLMIMCVQTICVSMREGPRVGERERESAVCFPYIIKRNFVAKHGQELSILSFCLLYLFVWPVSLWVLIIFLL